MTTPPLRQIDDASATAFTPPAPHPVARTPLTEAQRAVVVNDRHHLMIEAGAGAGKTTVLVEKILWEQGCGAIADARPTRPLDLEQMAAITFTRKAAGEIKERLRAEYYRRLEAATGYEREVWAERACLIDQALIGTIDSFAGRIIRDYGALAGLEAGFDILEPGDALALYHEMAEMAIVEGIGAEDPGALFLVRQFGYMRARSVLVDLFEQGDRLRECVARATLGSINWERVLGDATTAVDRLLQPHAKAILAFAGRAQEALVDRLTRDGVLDHVHVVIKAGELAGHAEVQRAFRERVKLLFVDEHQDTNAAQVRLLFRLVGIADAESAAQQAHGTPETRIVLIGDPKQSIYGFRHADITLWRRCKARLERAGGVYCPLTENHRSRPTVLRFIDDCLGRLMGPGGTETDRPYEVAYRSLQPRRPETPGPGVEVLLAHDTGASAAADIVAERVAQMLRHADQYPVYERHPDGTEVARPLRPRDIAILARNLKGVADHYERALRDRGVGCYIYGGRGLYGRQEVQDLTTLLRVIANPRDTFALLAFLRSPLGGVDDVTLAELSHAVFTAQRDTGRQEAVALYDLLARAANVVGEPARAARVAQAATLLDRLRSLRDRVPHHQLLEVAIRESHYRTFLAGAPDAPAGIRNIEKLLRVARQSAHEPLFQFVARLAARVRRADPEDEAPLYSPDDDLVTISTIHKAKGLEWPYVILTGIDDGFFHRIGQDEPRLSTEFGLALPLDVVLRDDRSEVPAPVHSAAWARYVEHATWREYAEAKRIFYVACTRARDRLILAGGLRAEWAPRTLDPNPEWMHKNGVEFWLRHLYRPLTQTGAQGASFEYGERHPVPGPDGTTRHERDRAVIRRGMAQMAHQLSATADGVVGHQPTAIVREWPHAATGTLPALPAPDGAAWPAAVAERIAPVEHRSLLRHEFTASELLQYARCPWKHFFGYVGSVSSPELEVRENDLTVNRILPEKRGDILHSFLRAYEPTWDDARMKEEMLFALQQHLPMGDADAEANVRELLAHANNYLRSPWFERVRAARTRLSEVPCAVQLAPDLRFVAKPDLLFREDDGWRILDFKTGLFRGQQDVDAAIAARAEDYRIQAAIYALALAASEPDAPIKEFVFFFTAVGKAHVLPITPDFLAEWRTTLLALVARIRRQDYGARPTYAPQRCHGCEYMRICQPAGAPADLVPLERAPDRG